jgi:hypothetical protein
MSRLSLLRICVIWFGMNLFWAIWKSITLSVTHSLLAISYIFSLTSLWHNWFIPPPPPKKVGKEERFLMSFLQFATCFSHFRLLCTVTVEHLTLVEPFTLLEMLCDNMVGGYWCRSTYWSHLQGSGSHVMLKSRLILLIVVCSKVL